MQTVEETKPKKETIWSAAFIILMAMNLLQSMAMYMTTTILPLYIDFLGASVSMVGVLISTSAVTAVVSRPFFGPAFDSFPRKRMFAIAQIICGTAILLHGFVQNTEQMMFARLLSGIAMGGFGPLAMALVSEQLPVSKMASGMSIFTVGASVAQVVGPAAGLWLSGIIGYANVFRLSGTAILLLTFGLVLVHEKPRELSPYKIRLDRIVALGVLDKGIMLMLMHISFTCVNAYLVLYSRQLGIEDVSMYFVVYALCLIATRPLFGTLADRFGAPKILVVGMVFFALSFVMLSQVRSLEGFIAVAVVSSLGYGACTPLVQSLALMETPLERRGAASNTVFLGFDTGNMIGPTIAGFLIDRMYVTTGSFVTAYSNIWLILLVPIAAAFAFVVKWNLDRKH